MRTFTRISPESPPRTGRPRWIPYPARLVRLSLAEWFLILAVPVGLYLIVVTPPGQGLDEPNHFYRTHTLSRGAIVAPSLQGRAGGFLPECMHQYMDRVHSDAAQSRPMRTSLFTQVPLGCRSHKTNFIPFENTAAYSPVAYAPQTIAVGLVRSLGASIPVEFYVGRIGALLGYLSLVWLALRIATDGRRVLFVVALMPMSLLLASSYSADGMTIGLALLSASLFLRCRFDIRATRRDFVYLVITLGALALTKPAYAVFAPLLLITPARLFPSHRRAVLEKLIALGIIALFVSLWALQVRDITFAAYKPVNPHAQLSFLVHHPATYVGILLRSLFTSAPQSYYVPGFVSSIGFFRAGIPLPPPYVYIFAFLLLFQSYLSEAGSKRTSSPGASFEVTMIAALAVVWVVLVETFFFLTWNPVGSNLIDGMQGRYFLPLAVLPLIAIKIKREPPLLPIREWPYIAASSALLAWCASSVFYRFY